jgi:hypothetical protein
LAGPPGEAHSPHSLVIGCSPHEPSMSAARSVGHVASTRERRRLAGEPAGDREVRQQLRLVLKDSGLPPRTGSSTAPTPTSVSTTDADFVVRPHHYADRADRITHNPSTRDRHADHQADYLPREFTEAQRPMHRGPRIGRRSARWLDQACQRS